MADTPILFRVVLEVSDLNAAVTFYSQLLGIPGRVQRGSRAYFDCGSVILAILDPTPGEARLLSALLFPPSSTRRLPSRPLSGNFFESISSWSLLTLMAARIF